MSGNRPVKAVTASDTYEKNVGRHWHTYAGQAQFIYDKQAGILKFYRLLRYPNKRHRGSRIIIATDEIPVGLGAELVNIAKAALPSYGTPGMGYTADCVLAKHKASRQYQVVSKLDFGDFLIMENFSH